MMAVFLIIFRIDTLLEYLDTNALKSVNEMFFWRALLDVNINQLADYVGHHVLGKRGAKNFAELGLAPTFAAQRDLVKLVTFFIHAENAYMPHMVVTTSVDAAGNAQVQTTNVE